MTGGGEKSRADWKNFHNIMVAFQARCGIRHNETIMRAGAKRRAIKYVLRILNFMRESCISIRLRLSCVNQNQSMFTLELLARDTGAKVD